VTGRVFFAAAVIDSFEQLRGDEMNTTQAGNIRANPLARHITIVLVVKVLLLTLIWWLFFRLPDSGMSERIDVGAHIAAPPPSQKYQP